MIDKNSFIIYTIYTINQRYQNYRYTRKIRIKSIY